MSPQQHVQDGRKESVDGYVSTFSKPRPPDGNGGVFALDCEMVSPPKPTLNLCMCVCADLLSHFLGFSNVETVYFCSFYFVSCHLFVIFPLITGNSVTLSRVWS